MASDLVRFLGVYRLDGTQAAGKPSAGVYFGSLPGTFTVLIQRADGVVIVALFNQRLDASGLDYCAIEKRLNQAAAAVRDWPKP